MELQIESALEGMLLRDFLRQKLGLSSGMVLRLKKLPDGILCNGEHVTVRRVLHAGDHLRLALEDREDEINPFLKPKEIPLHILYEDDDILLVDKPAGMPTHPSQGHHEDTLANALAYYLRDRAYVFRAVNRLDRNTSGVVLTAKNRPAAFFLAKQMQEKKIRKCYFALLDRTPQPEKGRIDLPIIRESSSLILRRIAQPDEIGGQPAMTDYATISASADGFSGVLAEPRTGRTHQLRVHFAAIGCPITGDDLYGHGSSDILRQALHAWALRFVLPRTGTWLTVRAALPHDMRQLAALRQISLPAEDFDPISFFETRRISDDP